MTVYRNKKVFLTSLMLLLALPLAFSQDLLLGVKGGVAFPFFLGEDYEAELDATGLETKLKYGFTGGVFLTWQVLDFLALQPEALFTMAGSATGSGDAREVLQAYYLEFPVLVKGVLDIGFGQISLYTGPDLLVKVGNFERVDQDGFTLETFDQDIFNRMVFNVVFGIDYNILLGPGRLFIDARYNWGITPIYDGDQVIANDYKQNMVQVFIGYGVHLYVGQPPEY